MKVQCFQGSVSIGLHGSGLVDLEGPTLKDQLRVWGLGLIGLWFQGLGGKMNVLLLRV